MAQPPTGAPIGSTSALLRTITTRGPKGNQHAISFLYPLSPHNGRPGTALLPCVGHAVLTDLWDHGNHECESRSSASQELESVARAAAVPPALPGHDDCRPGRIAGGFGRHAGVARGA